MFLMTKIYHKYMFVCVNAGHFLGCTGSKQRIKCLAQEHNTPSVSAGIFFCNFEKGP